MTNRVNLIHTRANKTRGWTYVAPMTPNKSAADGLTALVFPGQGSQNGTMRELTLEHEPALFEQAIELIGCDPFARVDEGTRFQQACIYCASIAAWTSIGRPSADAFAGHSLGELAALTAAGVVEPHEGLALVARRGASMDEAAAQVPGAMAALLGPREAIDSFELPPAVIIANDNSDGQVVISGPAGDVSDAIAAAKPAGLRAIRLPVSGAFHTSAMTSAMPIFERAFDGLELRAPVAPVFSCVTAEPFTDVRESLLQSLVSPVKWRTVMARLHQMGVRHFLEPGPGSVLSKLAARQFDDVTTKLTVRDAALA